MFRRSGLEFGHSENIFSKFCFVGLLEFRFVNKVCVNIGVIKIEKQFNSFLAIFVHFPYMG